METMGVIAILIIVAGLAFVAVNQYLRTTYQREMDETAKEIYLAAQSHLTIADSLGVLPEKTNGTPVSEGSDVFYYVVPPAGNDPSTMLYTMLPPQSIDETVRSSGSYIIRYQYNGSTAAVLDVFYADPRGRFSYTITSSDYSTLFGNTVYTQNNNDGKEARAHYPNGGNAVIGYYGGTGESSDHPDPAKVPQLVIENAEKLVARIENATEFSATARVEYYVTGLSSGAVSTPISIDAAYRINKFACVLDSVTDGKDSQTQKTKHFADLESSNGKSFIPGENIKVQAFVIDGSKVWKSAKRTTNSLFASLNMSSIDNILRLLFGGVPLPSEPFTYSAKISNIRHLENMSSAVSNYDPNGLNQPGKNMKPSSYEQTTDLSWSDFCQKTSNSVNGIYPMTGDPTGASKYMPVDWTGDARGALTYKGNNHKISDVDISASGNAGLFGTANNLTASDIVLTNFKVQTSANNAGALLGSGTGTTSITNTLAYNDVNADAAYEIAGASATGGLVGDIQGGSITQSAAALYVRSSGGPAGGLVGNVAAADPDNPVTISQSYSGGHTYSDVDGKTEYGVYLPSTYSGADGETPAAGRINVYSANGVAGGLVGNATNLTTTNSYSTCSVKGGTNAGGFVGTATGASVTNCYSTGLSVVDSDEADDNGVVKGDATRAGSFAGSFGGTVTGSYYLDIINYNQKTKGNNTKIMGVAGETPSDPDGLSAIDKDAGTYSAFMSGYTAGDNTSRPYDSGLATVYGTKFPFKTIVTLAGLTGTQPSHLGIHYGDWPSPETLVVNVGGGGSDTPETDAPLQVVSDHDGPLMVEDIIQLVLTFNGQEYSTADYDGWCTITARSDGAIAEGAITYTNDHNGIRLNRSGDFILEIVVTRNLTGLPAGTSATVAIHVERKGSQNQPITETIVLDDTTNASFTVQYSTEGFDENGFYSDRDVDAILADDGLKKGCLYTVGSTVYYCYKDETNKTTIKYNWGAALLELPGFSFDGNDPTNKLKYSGTPVNGDISPFTPNRGEIVKQDGLYYVTTSYTGNYSGAISAYPGQFDLIKTEND